MKPTPFVRELTPQERTALQEALRSGESFTLRRAQIILASSRGEAPLEIARQLSCAPQTVRNAIHAFNKLALGALQAGSSRPKSIRQAFDEKGRQRLREIAHQSPRLFGKERSCWSLEALAEVAFEEALTKERVSIETIRRTIGGLGASWRRAKQWIRSPDEQYALKKSNVTV